MGDWPDFINGFLDFTDGIPSPHRFRLWAGIACVAGALERRVYAQTSRSALYPNLFTLLVAPPAIGKSQAITPMTELWYAAKKFKIAPDNVTKASLVDALQDADGKRLNGTGLIEYHSLLVGSSEFGVLVPAHDLEFLSVLNHIYDNPRTYRENRRSLAKQVDITNPQLNIIAGTQPGFLANLLPEEAWTMGFASRLIMIYAGSTPEVSLFDVGPDRSPTMLIKQLQKISELIGCIDWADKAKAELETWVKSGCPPAPTHSKLAHYIGRRKIHTIKLAMISAISRTGALQVELIDVERAKTWLLEAETVMPDIFREMIGKSDGQVIQELHIFMWEIYVKSGKDAASRKPLHSSRLMHFLSNRVPSEKAAKIIEVASASNVISRMAGTDLYTPRPAHEHGEE